MISRIKRLWQDGQGVQSAATLLMVTMLLSNILGLLRDSILANTIPLTDLDIYYAAFRLPDFLFNLFILGAISSAFIPVFVDVKTKEGDDGAWHLAHNLLHTSLLVLLVLGSGLFVFMPQLLPSFVPGFPAEKLSQTVPIARILLLAPFFFAASYILGGILNANKKFFAYALAPLMYNLSIIIGGFLSPNYGIEGVAWAVVLGAALHAIIQVPTLLGLGYHYKFVLNPFDENLLRIIRLMIPRSVSLGMHQIMLLFFTRIASLLPSGSVSIFTITNNFQTAPTAIFAAAIGTAVFPFLGQANSEGNDEQYKGLLTNSLKGMFFFMIPSMALLWVLRAHIIRLFLALNHQTWEDTIRAIDTFGWFIIALAAQGFIFIMIRAFYANKDTRRPMYIAIVSGLLAILLARIYANVVQDVPALSMAFATAVIIEALILLVVFQRHYKGLIDLRSVGNTLVTASSFAVLAAIAARVTLSIVSEGAFIPVAGLGTNQILPLFVALLSGAIIGGGTYLLLSLLFRRSEVLWIWPKRAVQSVLLPETEEIASREGLA